MTRSRADIMRDLKAILAELDYVMGADTAGVGPDDLSPKLQQALNRETTDPAGQMALGHQTRIGHHGETRQTHEDIRAKARAYKDEIRPDEVNRSERKERLKDYTPAHDPDWDNSPFLGTGDQRE